jgi:hypothetical protein
METKKKTSKSFSPEVSGGDAKSVSSKAAIGLMQLMPATYAELRTRYGFLILSILTTIFWPEPHTFASCSTNMASAAFWRSLTPTRGAMRTIFEVALCRPKRRIMSDGLRLHIRRKLRGALCGLLRHPCFSNLCRDHPAPRARRSAADLSEHPVTRAPNFRRLAYVLAPLCASPAEGAQATELLPA